MKARLTKRSVEAAPVPEKQKLDAWLWDTDVPGFGCRVTNTGKRVYVLQTRVNGRTRRFRLGSHGAVTTENAREKAKRMLADILRGDDPVAGREAARHCPTMAELASRYLTEHAAAHKKPSSVKDDKTNLRLHVLPALGRLTVREVSREHVWRLHHSLVQKPFAANRVVALLSKMFNLAEQWGLRPLHSNPCSHVKKYRETPRERFLSELELARLGRTLRDIERERSEATSAVAAIRLLLLTGARVSEVLSLRWDSIDWERSTVRLTDSKTGPKTLVLGRSALDLLASMAKNDPVWVIPGAKPGTHWVEIEKPWQRIRARAGLRDVRLHDLRHTFASVGVGENISLHIVGGLLVHASVATTRRYAHRAESPLRHAADRIGDEMMRALGDAR